MANSVYFFGEAGGLTSSPTDLSKKSRHIIATSSTTLWDSAPSNHHKTIHILSPQTLSHGPWACKQTAHERPPLRPPLVTTRLCKEPFTQAGACGLLDLGTHCIMAEQNYEIDVRVTTDNIWALMKNNKLYRSNWPTYRSEWRSRTYFCWHKKQSFECALEPTCSQEASS